MAYIWNNYNKEKYYSMVSSKQSSYVEVWDSSSQYINVNVNNRLSDVFYPKQLIDEMDLSDVRWLYQTNVKLQDFMNVVFHYIAQEDRMRGITKEDVLMQLLLNDMEEGKYGEYVKNNIRKLSNEHQYIILKMLLKYENEDEKRTLFEEVLYLVFGKVIIYLEQSSGKTYVYVEQPRTEYNELLFRMIQYLFMDMNLLMENYWANEHFGIIGVDSTMKIGKFTIE